MSYTDLQYYYLQLYKFSVHSAVISPATCTLTPGSVELATSKLTPDIAILVNAEGLAVAFSAGEYIRAFGPYARTFIRSLDPSTLVILKGVGLQSYYVPSDGGSGAGMPAAAYVAGLWFSSGNLGVYGSFTGNAFTEDPSPTPWPYPLVQGENFSVIYPDFFSQSSQSPHIFTY
ncbi:MAG: hypothetical protein ABW123_27805 [Cystobacter sp.]